MNNQLTKIHLRNILSCLHEIEHYCTDTNYRQLEDEDFLNQLKIHFTILGLEAANADLNDPVMDVLKSFLHMDFDNDLGSDRYALYHFIVNDITMLKEAIWLMEIEHAVGSEGIKAA